MVTFTVSYLTLFYSWHVSLYSLIFIILYSKFATERDVYQVHKPVNTFQYILLLKQTWAYIEVIFEIKIANLSNALSMKRFKMLSKLICQPNIHGWNYIFNRNVVCLLLHERKLNCLSSQEALTGYCLKGTCVRDIWASN